MSGQEGVEGDGSAVGGVGDFIRTAYTGSEEESEVSRLKAVPYPYNGSVGFH